jgi:hypothetical protein
MPTPDDTAARPFDSLGLIHDDLTELFALHQELLLTIGTPAGRTAGFAASVQMFTTFRDGLNLHMRHEEELLLPLFDGISAPRRWSSDVYRGEHDKMRALLAGVERDLATIESSSATWRRRLLAFLDREATFRHLQEHHDHAEMVDLFRVLDAHAARERAAEIMGRCWSEWTELRDRVRPVVTSARELLATL